MHVHRALLVNPVRFDIGKPGCTPCRRKDMRVAIDNAGDHVGIP